VAASGVAGAERIRTAEVVGALCLATDLGMGLPFEHGLQSTLFTARLGERLGADDETLRQAYYACLLFHSACMTDAHVAAEIFGRGLGERHAAAKFGSSAENFGAILRALPSPSSPRPVRVLQVVGRLPKAGRAYKPHMTAMCEVAEMLAGRLGMPDTLAALFAHLTDRWDGKGPLRRAAGTEVPLPLRIAHVARDAALQRMLGGPQRAAEVVRARAGAAFDPEIATLLADGADELLALDPELSVWEGVLACEPAPCMVLEGAEIDRALAAMGDFADLSSPYLSGHSSGVARLAAAGARSCGLDAAMVTQVERAGFVHDLGRVAVHPRIWQKPGPLTPDELEHVRLHPYHAERVLLRSGSLAPLAELAGAHHERLDGSGYHRGTPAAGLSATARLLAAADAYHAMTEPRPHRAAFDPGHAGQVLTEDCRAGLFDADAVAAVLAAAGQPAPQLERPAGLTEREVEVVRLLARGLQTKQVAQQLGVSAKTADRHVQNAYAKLGVSTRAGATMFAMEHGLLAWGELPMAGTSTRS
jgi:HD-GYP domain-containing protein (c-di-GMP phosphodiesterase class II)